MRATLLPIIATQALVLALLAGCSSKPEASDEPPTCNAQCRDRVATFALRSALKLTYNLTLQGNKVGAQDETTACPGGGSARIHGTATADGNLGVTEVDLVYELDGCRYQHLDQQEEQSFDMKLTGTVTESGILAVQPSLTTALVIESDDITFDGEVFQPAQTFDEDGCTLQLAQDANHLSGSVCDRQVGLEL